MCDNRYDAVLFDLYGTLVDIRTDEESDMVWGALRLFLSDHGAHYHDNDMLREAFAESMRAAEIRAREATLAGKGGPSMIPAEWVEPDALPVYRALFAACGVPADDALAGEAAWVFRRASTTFFRLYPGCVAMLDRLRFAGLRLVLVTNAQACYTMPELQALGLASRFDYMMISSREGVRKPSPDLFYRAVERAGVPVDRAVMVGNDEHSDIRGAAGAGIEGVYFHTEISPADDAPESEYAVRSFEGADYRGLLSFILGEAAGVGAGAAAGGVGVVGAAAGMAGVGALVRNVKGGRA